MDKECQKRIAHIANGFHTCKTAFIAIGDETRQAILLMLIQNERSGIRTNETAERAHLTRPSVSRYLQILKEAGITDMRKGGTKNHYYISADNAQWKQIRQLTDFIYDSVIHLQKEEEEGHLRLYIFQEPETVPMWQNVYRGSYRMKALICFLSYDRGRRTRCMQNSPG